MKTKRPVTNGGGSKSAEKGRWLENEVENILKKAKRESEGRLAYVRQGRIVLDNGETVIPDFSLTGSRPHEIRRWLVECQNRNRSSKEILHKIQHVRT